MKKFTKYLPMAFAVVLGVALFYGMAHAGWFGAVDSVTQVGVSGASTATAGGSSGIMGVIRSFLNWVLGILSLIALIVLLYGGFSMVTAAGDDAKYKKGFKILQQAAVGLAIVGLSWIIVSAIFWVIGGAAGTGSGGVITE